MASYSDVKEIINLIKNGKDVDTNSVSLSETDLQRIADKHAGYHKYRFCEDCSVFTTDTTETANGDICESCIDEYTLCYYCDDFVKYDEVTCISGENYCEYCMGEHTVICGCCDNRVLTRDSHESDDGTVCESCYENYYTTCDSCNRVINMDDCSSNEDGMYCNDCYDESGVIKNYDTKAEKHLPWGTPEYNSPLRLYFGMELEVEARNNRQGAARQLTDDLEGRVILCDDGSLNNGFEIKTSPCSLQELKDIAEAICDSSARDELTSHDPGTCGLHIHITRNALTQMQQGKIYEFVNNPINKRLVKALSRRYCVDFSEDGHTNYTRIEGAAHRKDVRNAWRRYDSNPKKLVYKNGTVNKSRYTAVNFTTDTVEVRIIRGTLNKSTLLACIEWIGALVYFTKTGAEHAGQASTTDEFCDWLVHQPDRNSKWRNLTKYLVNRNFLPSTILPKEKPCA